MNSKVIMGIGIGAGVIALIAGGIAIKAKIDLSRTMKQISKETGIPYKEVQASFREFGKEVKAMRKNGATVDQIQDATIKFFEEFESKSA